MLKKGGIHLNSSNKKSFTKRGLVSRRQSLGWLFVLLGVALIALTKFYPMIHALIMSFETGIGMDLKPAGIINYKRLFQDDVFKTALFNTVIYLIQIPIMLILALFLASLLNDKELKGKGLYRTMIFLPSVTAALSYSTVFRAMFVKDGLINSVLMDLGIISSGITWLESPWLARLVIVLALTWRWTGYNMVFYLSGMQNIDDSLYEAAELDGASKSQQLRKITMPLLKPIIVLTVINSINGTLQLFTETDLITSTGPGNATLTLSNYIYKLSFEYVPQYGYAAAVSYVVFIMVAVLSMIQMKVGDTRD